ncbi:hypothetical protein [Kordiimonas pumila]|uniref:DUF4142 domain-containing protein n=1 Tax=Kordiimonas pumila TaxID=2161677 RepID=A0ABV7D7L1_9PROT|nr:hypothetical protein [Kordiimonas pumila]
MKPTRLILCLLCLFTIWGPVHAQSDATERKRPSPLDARGGIPIPKNLNDLKNISLTYWLKFRKTNQQLYNYINEAAEFHAYLNVCKRHELHISMDLIVRQANINLQAAIPAHYDEPEFGLLDPLSKEDQQAYLDDMSSDLYAFEYGYRVALLDEKVAKADETSKVFCETIQEEYYKKYVALLATARRNLANKQ